MSKFSRYMLGAFDNGLFMDELVEHSTEQLKDDPVNSLIAQVNALGYAQLPANDNDIKYLADCFIVRYTEEPLRYSGEVGYRKVLLGFLEIAQRYKIKMSQLRTLENLIVNGQLNEALILDNGSALSNYAEDPQTLNQVITDEGILNFISNQSFDKTKKGYVEGVKDFFNSLRMSKVKNYVEELKNLFGDVCMYPRHTAEFYNDYDDED